MAFDILKVDIYQTIENLSKYRIVMDPGTASGHLYERVYLKDIYITARDIWWACGCITLDYALQYKIIVDKEMDDTYHNMFNMLVELGFVYHNGAYCLQIKNIEKALKERHQPIIED